MSKQRKCILSLAHGTWNNWTVVVNRLLDAKAVAVFVEPEPTEKKLPGFDGLWLHGKPTGVDWTKINEVRFFFKSGWVHLTPTDWAAFWEADKPHEWNALLPASEPMTAWDVVAETKDILLYRDWKRYGLHERADKRDVIVTEYTLDGRLVGWRLEPK